MCGEVCTWRLVFYPLCNVRIKAEGHLIQRVAAVFDTLPTSGNSGELLGMKIVAGSTQSLSGQQVLALTTRARAEEEATGTKSSVTPKPVGTSSMDTEKEVWNLGTIVFSKGAAPE